jgi:hypothetical protein
MGRRLKRFVILALVGMAGHAIRKKIQERDQAAGEDQRMAREVPS